MAAHDPADARPRSRGRCPALRYITNTAAALPPAHIERLRAAVPRRTALFDVRPHRVQALHLPAARQSSTGAPGSVGIAIPNTEAYVVDDDGDRSPPGVIGELVIRGPHVMQGYWENRRRRANACGPAAMPWEKVLYTGDLFRMDEEGFLYFVGRKDDIIKTRGEKVAPKEVESGALRPARASPRPSWSACPTRCSARPSWHWSSRSEPRLTERDVIAPLRQPSRRLHGAASSIEFRTTLPKTDTGKVSRRLAAEALETAS